MNAGGHMSAQAAAKKPLTTDEIEKAIFMTLVTAGVSAFIAWSFGLLGSDGQ